MRFVKSIKLTSDDDELDKIIKVGESILQRERLMYEALGIPISYSPTGIGPLLPISELV